MSKAEYNLIVFHETRSAVLVGKEPADRERDEAFWLPKSQIDRLPLKDGWETITVPDWLAEEKGLDPSLDGEPLMED